MNPAAFQVACASFRLLPMEFGTMHCGDVGTGVAVGGMGVGVGDRLTIGVARSTGVALCGGTGVGGDGWVRDSAGGRRAPGARSSASPEDGDADGGAEVGPPAAGGAEGRDESDTSTGTATEGAAVEPDRGLASVMARM